MKGKPGSGAGQPAKPQPFVIAFRASNARGPWRWSVLQGTRWRSAHEVSILTPVLTAVHDGVPVLVGEGVVRCTQRGHLVVMP